MDKASTPVDEKLKRLEQVNESLRIHLKNYMDIAVMFGNENRDLRKELAETKSKAC